jgi:hypothetical protein
VNYFDREYFYKSPNSPGPLRRIPLVNPHEYKIAGVSVGNLNAPITDERLRKEIEKALKGLTFHLEYVRVMPKAWFDSKYISLSVMSFPSKSVFHCHVFYLYYLIVKEQRGLNKSDSQIQRSLKRVKKNLKIKPDVTRGKASILWVADDPDVYSFTRSENSHDENKTDEEEPAILSVAQYFEQRHGVRLRYPKLPIVHVGDKNWYPIEFMYQAFERTKDANSPTHVSDLLKHFDENAGNRYVDEISSLLKQIEFKDANFEKIGLVRCCEPGRYCVHVYHFSAVCNLSVSLSLFINETCFILHSFIVELSAKILDQPHLKFGNQDASVSNGDWNLRGVQFAK